MQQQVLIDLPHANNKYPLEQINCFEKPLGILLSRYNHIYPLIFYLHLKLYALYNIDATWARSSDYGQVLESILSSVLGVPISKGRPSGDFIHFITYHLNKGNIVLVPGNLKELYYSRYYKTLDWPHWFLINGFDDTKGLFFTIDGCHKSNGHEIYEQFSIQYETLQNVFQASTCEKPPFVYYVEHASVMPPLDSEVDALLISFLLTFKNSLLNPANKEIQAIEEIQKRLTAELSEKERHDLLRIYPVSFVNDKKLLFNGILECLEMCSSPGSEWTHFVLVKDCLIRKWHQIFNIVSLNLHRKRGFDLRNEIDIAVALENEAREMLPDLSHWTYKVLPKYKYNNLEKWQLENNNDDIIRVDDGTIAFNFPGRKLYDAWLSDCAPKAFFNYNFANSSEFMFETRVTIVDNSSGSNCHAGIVFKDTRNELYFWGLNEGMVLNFVKIGTGKGGQYTALQANSSYVWLQMEKKNEIYYLRYAIERSSNFQCAHILQNAPLVSKVGIGCKTWGLPGPMIINFHYTNCVITKVS